MLAKTFDSVVRVAISTMPVVRPRCTALAAAMCLHVLRLIGWLSRRQRVIAELFAQLVLLHLAGGAERN